MRAVVFKFLIILLILGGGKKFYANQLDSVWMSGFSHGISKNKHDRFSHKDHHSIVIEDNDIDLEEEHSSGHSKRESNSIQNKNALVYAHIWHYGDLLYSSLRGTVSDPTCSSTILGQTRPIYLVHRVLRI